MLISKVIKMNKIYDTRTISFGKHGSETSSLVKHFVKKEGAQNLSKLIQELINAGLSNKPGFNNFRKEFLILRKRELLERIEALIEETKRIDTQLIIISSGKKGGMQ